MVMPILNCFIKKKQVSFTKFQKAIKLWSNDIQVDEKEICMNVLQTRMQIGKQYKIMINLFLPSIWKNDIEKIQISLIKYLVECLNVNTSEIFLFTSIINSGNVIENGEVVEW